MVVLLKRFFSHKFRIKKNTNRTNRANPKSISFAESNGSSAVTGNIIFSVLMSYFLPNKQNISLTKYKRKNRLDE